MIHSRSKKSFSILMNGLGGYGGRNILGAAANFAVGEANYGLAEMLRMAGRKTGTESEAELVRALLRDASKKLHGKAMTVTEFIKLLQLRREFESEELKGDRGPMGRTTRDGRCRQTIEYAPLPSQARFHRSPGTIQGFLRIDWIGKEPGTLSGGDPAELPESG